jgi:subtilase family serine protease
LEGLESRVLLSAAKVATHYSVICETQMSAVTSITGMTPSEIRSAYGIDQVMFGSVTGDGTGQTIAIVDAYNDPNIAADLHAFNVAFGLADTTLTILNQNGGTTLPRTDPAGAGDSWALEISLDVEWAHAAAPGANIVLIEANSDSMSDLMTAVKTARSLSGVSVVSMSWGADESSSNLSYNKYFTTPTGHTGITFVASSGDNGAYGSSTTRKTVSYPAASPNILAVGGTTLEVDDAGNYLSETGWGSGSQSAADGGSGGGISKYERQSSYQKGVVTQTSTYRAVPDVSIDGDPSSGVAVYDSWDSPDAPWMQIGGTSLGAPLWAGIIAITNQGRTLAGLTTLDGATQTLPMLYSLSSADFHDITSGNNGYAAGTGYDLVTGRGTPLVEKVVADLVGTGTVTNPVPTIGALTISSGEVVSGANITLTASGVSEIGGTITAVTFYRESNSTTGLQTAADTLVGTGVQNGSSWTITLSTSGLAAGTYTYYAVATDGSGVSSAASSTTLSVTVPAVTNDNFATATVISGISATVTGTNVNATKENREASITYGAGGKSVWWVWTAPASGMVTLDTKGSNFDTMLGVYTGGSVSKLTRVAANDDASYFDRTSKVRFNAIAGKTYYIAVDGYRGATGDITLNLALAVPPANDNFAKATVLTGTAITWSGSNVGATREAVEPAILRNRGGTSVWLVWTAPASGNVIISTAGSSFDTMLAVYSGSSLATLRSVAANDDVSAQNLSSAVTLNVVADQTYYIQIDGYNGATGNISLSIA